MSRREGRGCGVSGLRRLRPLNMLGNGAGILALSINGAQVSYQYPNETAMTNSAQPWSIGATIRGLTINGFFPA